MTKNCKNSLYAQLFYMVGVGAGFLFMPQVVSSILLLGPTEEVWIRVLGALALVFGSYYYAAIQQEALWFAKASITGRYGFVLGLWVLSYSFAIPMLGAVGALEGALAVWTQLALKR
ncbi:MAG: hypothetical protein ACOYPR_13335 [Saprospiraceae bacterium]